MIRIIEVLPIEQGAMFLYQFLAHNEYNREMVFDFLSKLREPFSSVKLNGGQIKITSKHANVKE
ncbi:hypothetical protein [Bacillus nitroreducens]